MSESREEKRTRLVAVAIEVLGRHGVKKTNLDDIARAAGMATTSLYYYFPNKNELVRAALSATVDALLARIEEVVHSSRDPEAKLVESWKILFRTIRRTGLLLDLDATTKSEVLHLAQDLVEDYQRRYTAFMLEVLEEGQSKGVFRIKHPETTALVLSVGIVGLLVNTAGQTQFDLLEQQIDEIGELLMNGLRRR
ncbi:MAG TPA: TetR/AcrR family transcriptional regulator [Holophaga sp.]|nr:TetR/AcrR family transcriptional regulator [Holophaga sp.]